jgi:two-component system response regulator FlrC
MSVRSDNRRSSEAPATNPALVLLVEDDPALREALTVTLELENIAFRAVDSAESALREMELSRPGMVVSDIRLPGIPGIDLLTLARDSHKDLPVVLMTAFADARMAVDALRAGARDFLLKPFRPEQLVEVVRRYLPQPGHPLVTSTGPVAVDPTSRRLLQKLERVAQTDATVLLLGESGSGKEVMAQFVHQRSPRCKQAFVAINCAAIPSTLLESTLFGFERGAFTGAGKSHPGKFELAQGGSLFLDEIGEMPLELQAKLLRVLQERQVERVGSHQTVELNVRMIAATNQDLSARVAKGLFREDLFYRLNVFPLRVPALRERPADILALAERFLLKYRASMGLPEARLSEASRKALVAHVWPGNVRELENAIQRGLLLCDGIWIHPGDLDLEAGAIAPEEADPRLPPGDGGPGSPASKQTGRSQSASRGAPRLEGETGAASGVMNSENAVSAGVAPQGAASADSARGLDGSRRGEAVSSEIRDVERDHILKVLREAGGNRKRAVEILGMSDRTLRHKLKLWREAGVAIP